MEVVGSLQSGVGRLSDFSDALSASLKAMDGNILSLKESYVKSMLEFDVSLIIHNRPPRPQIWITLLG
jgi:hypothetical protein